MLQPVISAHSLRQIKDQAKHLGIDVIVNSLGHIDFSLLVRHKTNTHKGDFGTVAIIGGNKGMHGSMYLAGRAAALCGAGKVILASLDNSFISDMLMPELMTAKVKDVIKHIDDYSVVVIGPGLGRDDKANLLIKTLLDKQPSGKFIFDADALNVIAMHPNWHYPFRNLPHKIITPHVKEASVLLATEVEEVQRSRVSCVKKLSEYYNATTVLKGHHSLIYDGASLTVNPTGNQGLSNAGQGDTLCGIIASCVAQGLSLYDALLLGVYIHGLCADVMLEKYPAYIGMIASEVAYVAREIINKIAKLKK